MPAFVSPKSIEVFTRHNVLTESEIRSRYEILLENYGKIIHIEALTMIDMVKREIIPGIIGYQNELARLIERKKVCVGISDTMEAYLLSKISELSALLLKKLDELEKSVLEAKTNGDHLAAAKFYRYTIFMQMSELRLVVDELETMVGKKYWSLPTYAEILYSVN